MTALLVVAGEASGDSLAAPVVVSLGVASFGLGGARLAGAGTELVADLSAVAAIGVAPAIRRAPAIVSAALRVLACARKRRPSAALLVGFSEVNARIAAVLSSSGTRVLWYAPPQVWAWRAARARTIGATCERLAVTLPFERVAWAAAGASADYVGHPALAHAFLPAPTTMPLRVAILPGSRAHEARAHLDVLLDVASRLARSHGAVSTVVRARLLDATTAGWMQCAARARGLALTDAQLGAALAGHHVALVASGTATLECAAAGVPPVIVYRTDPLTYGVARRLVRVKHIGLPNLVLDRRAFPELVQAAFTPEAVASGASQILRNHEANVAVCAEVRGVLEEGSNSDAPHERVARLLGPWLT